MNRSGPLLALLLIRLRDPERKARSLYSSTCWVRCSRWYHIPWHHFLSDSSYTQHRHMPPWPRFVASLCPQDLFRVHIVSSHFQACCTYFLRGEKNQVGPKDAAKPLDSWAGEEDLVSPCWNPSPSHVVLSRIVRCRYIWGDPEETGMIRYK